MVLFEREVADGDGQLRFTVRYDSRLRRNVRWSAHNGVIEIRAPRHASLRELERITDGIIARVLKQRARARRRQDIDLQERAQAINRRYFGGELTWHTIRWADNMARRLGSCTTGGSTDGDIRISARIRTWPSYVVDYVIAHELVHRRHPDHSPAFWATLSRYPHVERARGFIEGVAFAENADADSLL